MLEKIAIRDAFGEALVKLGAQNEKVIALDADVGSSSKSILFGRQYPERYFNVGISELDMVAMSAGFAAEGLIPFVNTFATFLTGRAGDAINNLIAYDNLNVKLCGTYSGISNSYDGSSHNSICDMSYVRAIPNMTLITTCDAVETEKAVFAIAYYNGPVYLRISRALAETVFDQSYKFEIGKGVVMKDGKDITLVATGYMVQKSLEAAKLLERDGIDARVVNIHTIKPLDCALIQSCACETGAIVTVEEHSIYGGLGGAVAETVAASCPVPMGFIGIDTFCESGDYETLLHKYKMDAVAIAAKAKAVLKK